MKSARKLLWPIIGLVTIALAALAAKMIMPHQSDRDAGRKIAFYQDSMHPWIKSAQPGKCTICAMDLTPIYEGSQGLAVGADLISLNSNNVTVLNVQTEAVKRAPLQRTVRVAGILEANETTKRVISASRDGRVQRLAVPHVGFEVIQGQPLVNYFVPELLAEARRYVFLAQAGSQSSRQSSMDMSNPLLSAMQNLRLFGFTEGQIDELARTGKAEGSFDMLSPITGTVIERNVSEGQYVSQGTRLFTIVDLSTLWFRFDVYEKDLYWLQLGQAVEFTVPSAPGKVFSGPIKFIEPFINDTTRSAKVRVDVANPLVKTGEEAQRELRQQQYAEGWIQVAKPDRLVVPASAILQPGHQAYVYVDQGGGTYQSRQVMLGRRGDQAWEIISGLDEGDRVVVNGNVLLDAQAQFNNGGGHHDAKESEAGANVDPMAALSESAAPAIRLTQSQQDALSQLLDAADGVSKALAADNLEAFKLHAGQLPNKVKALAGELGNEHEWLALVAALQAQSQDLVRPDLTAARTAFLPFSTRMVDLIQHIRSNNDQYRSLKIYYCSMAPKPGLWFQAQGPLRNPYYGAEMLTCGKEIRPTSLLPKAPAPTQEQVAPAPTTVTSPPIAKPTVVADHPPGPLAALGRNFSSLTTGASPEVQPLNSRNHTAYEHRMETALAARFGQAPVGTNFVPAPITATRPARAPMRRVTHPGENSTP